MPRSTFQKTGGGREQEGDRRAVLQKLFLHTQKNKNKCFILHLPNAQSLFLAPF
jgi:hypothetical protein